MTQPEDHRGWSAAREPWYSACIISVPDLANYLIHKPYQAMAFLYQAASRLKLKEVWCALSTPAGCQAVTGPANYNFCENR
jgi:hypothetical protein